MKKIQKRFLITMLLLVFFAIPANAYNNDNLIPQKRNEQPVFQDTVGTWCASYVKLCYESGLMEGKSSSVFDPHGTLTHAQITAISARLLSALQGGDGELAKPREGELWYQPAYDLLVKSHILSLTDDFQSDLPSFDRSSANEPATREEFVDYLSRALSSAGVALPKINQMDSLPDVRSNSREAAILAFYNAGVLSGKDSYGSFDGNGSLNRGEAAAMLARIVSPSLRLAVTLKDFDFCRDVLELAPEAVLLYADGEPITAEVFGDQLIMALIQGGKAGVNDAVERAIREWCTYTQCYFTLAADKAVALTETQLADARKEAREDAGWMGKTEAAMLRWHKKIVLALQLNSYYAAQYDKQAGHMLSDDLATAAKSIHVERAPAMQSLNLDAVLNRALHSPFAYN